MSILVVLKFLQSLLPGIFSFVSSIFSNETARFTAGTTAVTAMTGTLVGADVKLAELKAAGREADRTWWVTAWEKPLLFYMCLLHFGAVLADTTFKLHLGIPKLPAPMDTYEGVVLLSDFLVLSTLGPIQKIISLVWK